jgi:hypothetical protein
MTIYKNGFETATGTYATSGATVPSDGTLVTTTQLGAGASLVVDTAQKAHGTQSMRIVPASGAICDIKGVGFTATRTLSMDMNVRMQNAPVDENYLFQMRSTTPAVVNIISLGFLSTGFLRVRTTGSNNLYTSTTALPLNVQTRIGFGVRLHATDPTLSAYRVAAFTLDSDTPISGLDSGWVVSSLITSNALIDNVIYGRLSSNTDTSQWWMDDLRVDDAPADLILAGVSAGLPTVSVALSPNSGALPYTMTATVSATGGTNINRTYGIDNWGDGTSSPEQAGNTFSKVVSNQATFTGRTVTARVYEDV